ncbi:mitochondrial ribosomal protein subunit L51-bS1m [Schizosaccharomyces osmophilus]|uniref:Mitochondrial ribosomal protein subunit L51-bS1m n=1 Tax=Schizosaccharomyces osmophilus TaxID=2545709 RepID=A0AAF0AYN9_9SCHI|nr:mitochondrial ribosomal protein subunit L51-bS1m [Schizosaccharomyces osmophilus]WBW75185.1 mitochondrial ribosomal protein subunit L51-bS1m [Schizosaccharomyces osmophilus]
MSFANLLRNSRAVSLTKCFPESSSSTANSLFPLQQSLTTKQAEGARGDWGCKRNLPRVKTRFISVNELDSVYNQMDFKSSARFVRLLRNWFDAGFVRDPAEQAIAQELAKDSKTTEPKSHNRFGSRSQKLNDYTPIENPNFRKFNVAGGIQYSNVPLITSHVTPKYESNSGYHHRKLTAHTLNSDTSTAHYGLGGLVLRLPKTRTVSRNRTFPLFSKEYRISYTMYKNGQLRVAPYSGPFLGGQGVFAMEPDELNSFFYKDLKAVAEEPVMANSAQNTRNNLAVNLDVEDASDSSPKTSS